MFKSCFQHVDSAAMTSIFLPIHSHTAAAFFESDKLPNFPSERAALFVIKAILEGKVSVNGSAKMLFDAGNTFNTEPNAADQIALLCKSELFDRFEEFAEVESALLEMDVALTPSWVTVAPDDWRNFLQLQKRFPTANMDFSFSISKRCSLSNEIDLSEARDNKVDLGEIKPYLRGHGNREQLVVSQTLAASADDEHVVIDAFAGTGKTHLVLALADTLALECTYLAPRTMHKNNFRTRITARVFDTLRSITIAKLANDTLRQVVDPNTYERMRYRSELKIRTLEQRLHVAEIPSVGANPPRAVIKFIEKAIRRFCSSSDLKIDRRHFRSLAIQNDEWHIYLALADRIWRSFHELHRSAYVIYFSLNHLAKSLALQNAQIPPFYGTLLVDEAHDLTPAWFQLFKSYRRGCVLMGDPYQRLNGRAPRYENAKVLHMSQSYRMGRIADDWIRKALNLSHLQKSVEPFRGQSNRTTILKHPKPKMLPEYGLLQYGNYWALLEAVQRFSNSGASFRLIYQSENDLKKLVQNALTLFSPRGSGAFGGVSVDGCFTRVALCERLTSLGHSAILRMFEKGFKYSDLMASLEKQAVANTEKLTLGMLTDVKNLEHKVVVMMPSCLSELGRDDFDPAHLIYLGMSRSIDELWMPGDSIDRLQDKAQKRK